MKICSNSNHHLALLASAFLSIFLILLPVTQVEASPARQEFTATSTLEVAAPEGTPTPPITPTATLTPAETTAEAPVAASELAILNGIVSCQGYPEAPNPLNATALELLLIVPGNTTPAYQFALTTNESGQFTQPDIPTGTYHIQLKHNNHIPALKWNITLNAGDNTIDFGTLKAGDVNNDAFVSATDFSLLSTSYGKCSGQDKFDERCDFNADNCVTAVDFSLFSSNYGQGGTINPLPTPTPYPTLTPTLAPTPTATSDIPPSASISNISGANQALPLNCESSSAVDWAGYYGTYINDVTFHNELPLADNPDTGFVGNVYGVWGQIPPSPYGVHADPIAANLRNHGLPATAVHNYAYEDLQRQIASGNPVIVWIIGHVWDGTPVQYTDSQGVTTTVARYEHTVMVVGYGPNSVTILDGNSFYSRSLEAFFSSWGVLNNMAVIHQ